MKPTKKILFFLSLAALYQCNGGGEAETDGTDSTATTENIELATTDCLAPASWFTMNNGNHVTPAPNEGPTSPFANNATVTNCDFHQWSWQKFLWLTTETNGVPFFLENLKQVSPTGQVLPRPNGVVLTDTAQASHAGDILKTPSFSTGTPPETTVYYAIFSNDLLLDTMIKYAPIAKNNPNDVTDVTFPVGALEVKTSWIAVSGLADSSNYFITNGEINGTPARVALLGMHVVGVVENHPEFVWATFEHTDLAPQYSWANSTTTTDAPVTSTTDYPFFAAGSTATVANISSQNGIFTNVFSLYPFGTPVQMVAADNGFVQEYMVTSQDGAENYNNISQINASVKSQLTDIWQNYYYNGSIWINTEGYVGADAQAALLNSLSYNLSNSEPGKLTRGSVSAYNITMETYVQAGFGPSSIHGVTVDNLANCFSCHNTYGTGASQSPLNFSHVYSGYLQTLQGFNPKQVKQNHVNAIQEQFRLRQAANN